MLMDLHPQSEYCRCCGTEVLPMPLSDRRYCPNLDRQCLPLGHTTRNYCELCGREDPGPGVCRGCGRPPVGPR